MMRYLMAILALFAMVFFFLSPVKAISTTSGVTPVTTSGQNHSWNQQDVPPGKTSLDGNVTNTGTSGSITYKYCAGNTSTPHEPHYTAIFRSGTKGTATAHANDKVTCEGGNTVAITGNNCGDIHITGNNSTVTVNGNGNSIDFVPVASGNDLTVNGNSNDIDLNNQNNSVHSNGTNNTIHN